MEKSELLANLEATDTDVFVYIGQIETSGYEQLCKLLDKNRSKRRKNVTLYLHTGGGNPNAGYRIARALIHHYGADNFKVAVPNECKSAGTLICIGASSLVICDAGELGPLDVQFQKQDEIFQQSSGLDILRGMTYLQEDALETFQGYLLEINGGSGLSTKVASEIASKLVIGIYEPMFSQIDPIRLGEMNAALQIAHEYGTRLNEKSKNLKDGSLKKLIHDYPTHGFVIDRSEARKLFERVEPPNADEKAISAIVSRLRRTFNRSTPSVIDFVETITTAESNKEKNASEPQGTAPDSPAQQPDSKIGERHSEQPAPGDAGEQLPVTGEQGPEGAAAAENVE